MKTFIQQDFLVEHKFIGIWNDKKIHLTRYTKDENINLFGEHISFVQDEDKKLIAMARVLKKYAKKDEFNLSKDEAKRIALDFLKSHAPDILENFKILWIDFHNEVIKDTQKTIITGLKVKCQNLNDKKYFWVIVGFDKSIMVFERDVIWDFIKAGRQTQKWIHDSYLKGKIDEK